MNTAKHTPGPWLRSGLTVYALMHHGWRKGVETFKNRFTLWVQGCDATDEELQANAELIAAAPELLEALSKLTEMYCQMVHSGDCGNWNPEDDIEIQEARAAIAKATYKEP